MADGVCCGPEIGVRKGPATVKRQVQVLVAVEERPVRVVQEVIAGEAELQLSALRLSESEILKHRDVRVEEAWARRSRHH